MGSQGQSAYLPGGLWTLGRGFRPRRNGVEGPALVPGGAGALGLQAGPRRPSVSLCARPQLPLFASGHQDLERFLSSSHSSFSHLSVSVSLGPEHVSLLLRSCFEKVAGSPVVQHTCTPARPREWRGGSYSFLGRRTPELITLKDGGLRGQVMEDDGR